jgi:hypothetical protein
VLTGCCVVNVVFVFVASVGKAHTMFVAEMRPEPKGSLVDTDVEIDLDVSEEFAQHQHQQQEQQQVRNAAGPGQFVGSSSSSLSAAGAMATTSASDEGTRLHQHSTFDNSAAAGSTSAAPLLPQQQQQQIEYSSMLTPEPAAAVNAAIAVRFKLPNGVAKSRRFLHAASARELFAFVAAESLALGLLAHSRSHSPIESIQVSTRFPARSWRLADVLAPAATVAMEAEVDAEAVAHDQQYMTLADMGLGGRTENIFVAYL